MTDTNYDETHLKVFMKASERWGKVCRNEDYKNMGSRTKMLAKVFYSYTKMFD